MFDRRLRAALDRPLTALARPFAARRVGPGAMSLAGLALGAGACLAIGAGARWLALGLWLGNRAADGLDGALARLRGASAAGGYIDILFDFAIYAGFVIGVAVDRPDARLAGVTLLSTYYVSGAAFLAWSSIAASHQVDPPDNRSLHFLGGLAEGAETIVVYTLLCIWPARTEPILWVFAAMVAVTALQRVWFGVRSLRDGARRAAPGG